MGKAPKAGMPTSTTGGVWSDRDNAALQKLLDPLRKPVKIEPFGMFGSEARGLICTPKGEVYDRVFGFLTTLNVMAGLVLSAIADLVQEPLDVTGLPEEKRLLGDIYNVLAYFSVTNQICVVMFSTYVLFLLIAHGHTPEIVYRALTYGGPLFGAMMLACYIPLMAWLGMMVLTAHIYFSFWPRWICTYLLAILFTLFHLLFAYYALSAFPRGMWSWIAATIPWGYCDKSARANAERFAFLMQASASSGVLAGKDQDNDGIVDAERVDPSPEEFELLAIVDAALPRLGEDSGGTRRILLLRALVAEGLTRERLAKVAVAKRGFEMLLRLFDLDQDEHGVHLTRGERVALALTTLERSGAGRRPEGESEKEESRQDGTGNDSLEARLGADLQRASADLYEYSQKDLLAQYSRAESRERPQQRV